jgi:hypothetical protein
MDSLGWAQNLYTYYSHLPHVKLVSPVQYGDVGWGARLLTRCAVQGGVTHVKTDSL